ncbi:PUA-like domain-containing protein [Phycomyces nitens]|nr:PUA-like domain-containing protein [Phycomyces nitens]
MNDNRYSNYLKAEIFEPVPEWPTVTPRPLSQKAALPPRSQAPSPRFPIRPTRMKPTCGFARSIDHIDLIAPSGRYKRKIPVEWSTNPIVGKSGLNIVPIEHQGSLPHVPVGYCTEMRMTMSSIGVHRPPIAGISGSQTLGFVVSIVMSGEYPEDEDHGDEFFYTGSGGRNGHDPTQTFDQDLTRSNLLLAKSCKVKLNLISGGDSGDNWQEGAPIRVVRGYNLSKNAQKSGRVEKSFGPNQGYRYDGIYKVTRYWPERGYTGHRVWRFHLRRDDPSPAPWTVEGKAFIRRHCRKMLGQEPNEERVRQLQAFRSILKFLVPDPGYKKLHLTNSYRSSMRKIDQEDANEPIRRADMRPGTYTPNNTIWKAIVGDQMNKRIWLRLLDLNYQNEYMINDQLTFIEHALTQPELQCMVCNERKCHKPDPVYRDGLNIPLVRAESLHCTRCDYNFCKDCLKPLIERKHVVCPNCLSQKSLCYNRRLGNVFTSMDIPH